GLRRARRCGTRRGVPGSCGLPRLGLDAAQELSRSNFLLLVLHDLAQHPGAWGCDLDGDLVGLDLDQRLGLRDRLAALLQPGQHLRARALGLLGRGPHLHGGAHRLARRWIAWVMRWTSGTAASSSSGLWGLGMSGIASRSTGASRA